MLKNLKKYSKIISLSTILLSTGCAPFQHINNQVNSKVFLGEQSRALKSLQATKYSNELSYNSEYDIQNVSETRFEDYFNAVSDKLQYELWAANCSDEEVYSTVGTFKANVLNCELSDAKNEQEKINIKYSNLKAEAKKLGIDVVDFDLCRNFTIPKLVKDFSQALSNIGISEQQIKIKQDVYEQYLISVFEQGNINLWSDEEFNLAMPSLYDLIYNYTSPQSSNDIQKISLFNSLNNIDFYNQSEQEYKSKLSIVLNWTVEHISHSSSKNEDSNDFFSGISVKKDLDLAIFKDYNSNNIGYSKGSSIKPEDMSKFFDFTYSKVQGCDYANEFFLDDIEPTESGEYNKDTLSNIYEVKSLDTFDSAYATYGLAEILPGFTLNARIKDLDSTTDSHKCSVEFELGISHNSNPDYVLWSDFGIDSSNSINDEEEPLTIKGEFPCLKNEDIYNVSNNVYSSEYDKHLNEYRIDLGKQKTEKYSVTDPESKKTEKIDVYFCDSKDQRTKLDDIMLTYDELDDSDTYDLKKNPVILDENATKGIISEEQWKVINDLNSTESKKEKFHTNQFIAPVGTRIDTNENLLWINLCIVDKFNGIPLVVKNIGWQIENQEGQKNVDSIPVVFNVDQENKAFIDAQYEMLSLVLTTLLGSGNIAASYDETKLERINSTRIDVANYFIGRICAESSLLLLVIAEQVIDLYAKFTVVLAVLALIFIFLTTVTLAFSSEEYAKFSSYDKNIRTFKKLHKILLPYKDKLSIENDVLSTSKINEYIDILKNPIAKYTKKLNTAKEAAVKINDYENWLGIDFLKSIGNVFFTEDTKKELDYDTLLKTWGNNPIQVINEKGEKYDVIDLFLPILSAFRKSLWLTSIGVVTVTFISNIVEQVFSTFLTRPSQRISEITPEEKWNITSSEVEEVISRYNGSSILSGQEINKGSSSVFLKILEKQQLDMEQLAQKIITGESKVWTIMTYTKIVEDETQMTCFFADSYNLNKTLIGNITFLTGGQTISNDFPLCLRDIIGERTSYKGLAFFQRKILNPDGTKEWKIEKFEGCVDLVMDHEKGVCRAMLRKTEEGMMEYLTFDDYAYHFQDFKVQNIIVNKSETCAGVEIPNTRTLKDSIQRARDILRAEQQASKYRKLAVKISTSPIKFVIFLALNIVCTIVDSTMSSMIQKLYYSR